TSVSPTSWRVLAQLRVTAFLTIHMVADLPSPCIPKLRVITDNNSDEKTIIAECITQLLATMIILLGIEYHVSCPSSDVNGDDDNMHFSAVPQLFAFTVQAIQAPKPTPDWRSSLYGNTSM
ncbi:hypothetical protein E4U47_000373, partial [Claviceps purpurea]